MSSIIRWSLEQARRTARAYAEGNMASIVQIWRFPDIASAPINSDGSIDAAIVFAAGTDTGLGDGVFDDLAFGDPGLEPPVLVYAEGPARLSNGTGPVTYTIGEQVDFFTSAGASIPIEVNGVPTDPQVNDLMKVVASNDPRMAGRWFRIVDVEVTGTLAAVRRMQLVGIQRSPTWDDITTPSRSTSTGTDIPPEWRVS